MPTGSALAKCPPPRARIDRAALVTVAEAVIAAVVVVVALGIFVAIAFGAWLWSAAGALIATPTLIVATAFITRLDAVTSVALRRARQCEVGA